MTLSTTPHLMLTAEQRRIVEWDEGPVVVIAGAGTGKTRVIVERVRHLLETHDDLLPEHLLVLTYNVKAAAELRARIEQTVGVATAGRHDDQQLPQLLPAHPDRARRGRRAARRGPDVLDGVAQVLLLQGPASATSASSTTAPTGGSARSSSSSIGARTSSSARPTSTRSSPRSAASSRTATAATTRWSSDCSSRATSGRCARFARRTPASAPTSARRHAARTPEYDPDAAEKAADREARRTIAGDRQGPPSRLVRRRTTRLASTRLAATYVIDGAALEVLRLDRACSRLPRLRGGAGSSRRARLRRADRGRRDRCSRRRPNVLRRWQRQFRYLLVDEFQDANVAQIELIELLGRTPDRPDNVMVVGDDDQSIYRFRGASFAAFAEFDARFSRPPVHAPAGTPAPARAHAPPLEQNFRSVRHVLTAADRLIGRNASRFEPDKRLRTEREDGDAGAGCSSAPGRRTRRSPSSMPSRRLGRTARRAAGRTSRSCIASTSTATRSSPGCATRTSRTRWSVG